ncbi:31784_t:CDS:2 [Gigaspora margarita]|uniref:31784_t:CDS:1 n=1 Tax=Gigaspora margarita TaxID=4874 RepID=A0ABN7USH2_GIGMA|nr:31784_t:CDS:2 [Gigaspora margarita]
MPVWGRRSDTKALNLVFNALFNVRVARDLKKLNRFYLDQLTDSNNQCLLLWPEIRIRLERKLKGGNQNANLNLALLAQEMYCKDPIENEHELKDNSNKKLKLAGKKVCYYTDGSLQKDDKGKGDIAVIEAAVV